MGQRIDLFSNSTSAGNFRVESVLDSSRISLYTADLRFEYPINFSAEASVKRGIVNINNLNINIYFPSFRC